MKCQFCKRKTDWDSSVGPENFIVCNSCFYELAENDVNKMSSIFKFIFRCGELRSKRSESK